MHLPSSQQLIPSVFYGIYTATGKFRMVGISRNQRKYINKQLNIETRGKVFSLQVGFYVCAAAICLLTGEKTQVIFRSLKTSLGGKCLCGSFCNTVLWLLPARTRQKYLSLGSRGYYMCSTERVFTTCILKPVQFY